jgi:pyrimidine operon attenuation protein/uracil phosphoribosyltransferase
MADQNVLLSANAINKALVRIAHEISEHNDDTENVVVVGIQKGGVHVATRLAALLKAIWKHDVVHGTLDVSMHRDDLDQKLPSEMMPTNLPFALDGKCVVLVDDVLFSGRTVRAALDALHHYGRPKRVQLAVMIDRGHRELPIKADFVGKNAPTSLKEHIDVRLSETHGDDGVYILRK